MILSEVKKNCVEKNTEQQLETKGIRIEQELIKMNQQQTQMNEIIDSLLKVITEQQLELLTAVRS